MTVRIPTRIVMVCAALGVATGLLVLPIVYLNTAISALGPVVTLSLVGIYGFAPALGLALLRRPGTGLLVALVAGLVQAPLSPFGWQMLMSAAMWAVPLELVFLVTRYRWWSHPMFAVAGAIQCAATAVVSWPLYSMGSLDVGVRAAALAVQPASGALVALLASLLAARLNKAGVAASIRPTASTRS